MVNWHFESVDGLQHESFWTGGVAEKCSSIQGISLHILAGAIGQTAHLYVAY